MAKYDLMVNGESIDSITEDKTPQEAMQYFRNLYGENQVDVCGVRIAMDGVVL
jgi:hypothetical protein